jgi:hypothetical protein
MSIRQLVRPLALHGGSPGVPRRMSNCWARPDGMPPRFRNVAGFAALREVNGDLMGRSHATAQRRNVRKG